MRERYQHVKQQPQMFKSHVFTLGLLVCFVFPISTWCQNGPEVKSATPPAFLGSVDLTGNLHTTYQFRSTDGNDDNDIYSYLSLRYNDIVKDFIDGAFSMSWHEDLDGVTSLRPIDDFDPFLDLDQAASNIRFKYYTGYLDIKHLIFDDSYLRVGRQFLEDIDFAHYDGATYNFSPIERLDIQLFGGRPITYFSSTSGDAIYGSNFEYRFTDQTKAAMRYYRYDSDPFEDDLAAVEVWHLFTPSIQTHAEFSLLDGDPYILKNDWFTRYDALDMDVNTQILHLFEDVSDHTINFNPFFPLLNSFEPFTYGSIFATKGMGEYWSLVGGFDLRFIDTSSGPVSDNTNRDFRRFTGGVEIYPTKQLTLSVMGEFWDVNPNDEFSGITGEVEYEPTDRWTLSAGVDYGEYIQEFRDEFLFYAGNQDVFRISPDVITYYAQARWRPYKKMFTSLEFEVEDSDFDEDNYYSLRFETGVNF